MVDQAVSMCRGHRETAIGGAERYCRWDAGRCGSQLVPRKASSAASVAISVEPSSERINSNGCRTLDGQRADQIRQISGRVL